MITALSLAFAQSPSDLAARVPAAREQLAACASTGCADDVGAKAAWLVAVQTYVDEGVADGTLAATVQALDPALFATLPVVLQGAASAPLTWATSSTGPAVTPTVIDLQEQRAAAADPRGIGRALTVIVQDRSGAPIPSAWVRFADAEEAMRVNTETSSRTDTLLYQDGKERAFHPGDVVRFEVFSPEHTPEPLIYVVQKKRRNELVVQLSPLAPWALSEVDPPFAHQAVDAWARWVEVERAILQEPSEEARARAEALRRETALAAREWMDLDGGERAARLCRMTGSVALCGG